MKWQIVEWPEIDGDPASYYLVDSNKGLIVAEIFADRDEAETIADKLNWSDNYERI